MLTHLHVRGRAMSATLARGKQADVKRGDPTDPDSVAATNKMVGWRKMLYVTMNRNQADRTKVFRTPRVRSVVLGEVVEI